MTSKKEIFTPLAPKPIGPYSQAIACGSFLFCSGQIPLTAEGQLIEGDIQAQTQQVLKNLTAILEAGNSHWKHVVKTTIYLKSMADFPKVNEVYAKYQADPTPARATVEVASLPKGVGVEIDLMAWIPA